MTTNVEIIDLGINNIGSVMNSFERLDNVAVNVISTVKDSKNPRLMVLPGNGTFSQGMTQLQKSGFDELLLERHQKAVPILGICLGMQLLFDKSEEGDQMDGLGIIEKNLTLLDASEVIPHAGWEDVLWNDQGDFGQVTQKAKSYYFMHSYSALDVAPEHTLAKTKRGDGEFISAVKVEQTVAVQFHPEKSSRNGAEFLKHTLLWCNGKI